MKIFTRRNTYDAALQISRVLWKKLILDLRKRGQNKRESGAFLMVKSGENKIVDYLCYDDLDPGCLNTGMIVFNGIGYRELWDYCLTHGFVVAADIHTHPGQKTRQSGLDKAHPMILQKGHVALIVPRYARRNARSFKEVGAYEYLGDYQWNSYSLINKAIAFYA
jgi:hypothetical protein